MTVSVLHVTSRASKATGIPGQISGPAISAKVDVRNASARSIALSDVFVDLRGADGTPGVPVSGNGSSALVGSLRAGASATGTYVFTISKSAQRKLVLSVSYAHARTVVSFRGTSN